MTEPLTQPLTVIVERTFAAPIQAVFDAWTDPEVMRRWWHPEPGGSTGHAESDLRVGGELRVEMNLADGDRAGGTGTYTVVDPPVRLAFTWLWDGEQTPSQVELRLTERDSATHVLLTHSGLPDTATAAEHEDGWRGALENLAVKAGL